MAGVCTRLHWDDDYRTGVGTLDELHLAIVLLYNDSVRALDSRASRVVVTECVDSLLSLIRHHFAWEERHFGTLAGEGGRRHAVDRARFSSVVQTLDGASLAQDAERFLALARSWIVEHIRSDQTLLAAAGGRDQAADGTMARRQRGASSDASSPAMRMLQRRPSGS